MERSVLQEYVGGRSCGLLGLGVSNLPLAERLVSLGLSVTVYDKKSPPELGPRAEALAADGVRFVTGADCFASPAEELLFRSPGLRPDLPGLAAAVSHGAELTCEIELTLKLTEAETFGVTGSDGKTTSTTLTGRFLTAEAERKASGRVLVGGNIGEPLLHRLDGVSPQDRVVMELSSFQLMTVERAPRFAAITNLSPNHLDWHRGMEEYAHAKENILGKDTIRFVTNAESPATAQLAARLLARRATGEKIPDVYLFSSRRSSFDEIFDGKAGPRDRAIYEKDGWIVLSDGKREEPLLAISRIRVPGRHNVENFMTAIGLTVGSVNPSVFGTVADGFCGVEHRLELVRTLGGVDYYNSSIDSSPSRTAAALSALAGRDVVAICGGYDKKIPFEPLAESLCRYVRAVVLTGATGEKIRETLLRHPDYRMGHPEIHSVPDFAEAVTAASKLGRPGGCVLLSPACASFDAFRNFAERGEAFRRLVKALSSSEQ